MLRNLTRTHAPRLLAAGIALSSLAAFAGPAFADDTPVPGIDKGPFPNMQVEPLPNIQAFAERRSTDIEVAGVQSGAMDPAPGTAVAALETGFLKNMIAHTREGIAMAQLAQEKATRPEIKALAATEVQERTAEVDKLEAYLHDWYGQSAPQTAITDTEVQAQYESDALHADLPDTASEMMRLEMAQGADFDKEFLNVMADHHAAGVMMAAPVLVHGYHEDLYNFANNVLTTRSTELKLFHNWLHDWFGVATPY